METNSEPKQYQAPAYHAESFTLRSEDRTPGSATHTWKQRGIAVECDGGHDHRPHGFYVHPDQIIDTINDDGHPVFKVRTMKR